MTTYERILEIITKFNDDYAGQLNLASPGSRIDLATAIYNVVMKQSPVSTSNDEQLELFTNKDE